MSEEREPWEQDDYSESWDSEPNQAMADMMTMSGPDDDDIEAEAERAYRDCYSHNYSQNYGYCLDI
jgi:hypothetical protein